MDSQKFCPSCNKEKQRGEFGKHGQTKDGLYPVCKECRNLRYKEWYHKNKEAESLRKAAYYRNNKDLFATRSREYRSNNKKIVAARNARWQAENKDKVKEKAARYYSRHREEILMNYKENREDILWRKRISRFLKKYKITEEEFNYMMFLQNGVCAICGDPPPDGKLLCVDHEHESGEVRGLLCVRCNTAIGSLRDNPVVIRSAAAYLDGVA